MHTTAFYDHSLVIEVDIKAFDVWWMPINTTQKRYAKQFFLEHTGEAFENFGNVVHAGLTGHFDRKFCLRRRVRELHFTRCTRFSQATLNSFRGGVEGILDSVKPIVKSLTNPGQIYRMSAKLQCNNGQIRARLAADRRLLNRPPAFFVAKFHRALNRIMSSKKPTEAELTQQVGLAVTLTTEPFAKNLRYPPQVQQVQEWTPAVSAKDWRTWIRNRGTQVRFYSQLRFRTSFLIDHIWQTCHWQHLTAGTRSQVLPYGWRCVGGAHRKRSPASLGNQLQWSKMIMLRRSPTHS